MNDQNLVQTAQTAVESILNTLEVARVVYVDDAHNNQVQVEDVIAAANGLGEVQLLTVFPELGNTIPDDPDVLSQKIRLTWQQLDSSVQVQRGQAVLMEARRRDGEFIDDIADVSILKDLIPAAKLTCLTPDEWELQKEQLLRDNHTQRTLFLFDRNFSKKGGDPDGGIKIIGSLFARNDIGVLICGLLTQTITPEMQPKSWIELSKEHSIPRDRFVPIPKLYLSKDPILFAKMLKFVALSPDFDKLKHKTKEIIVAAADIAANRVDEVSIYDLDHIVFQVSAHEGLWEPDMLFRLHAMFHRLESRRLAHEGGLLETIAAKLRAVSEIPASSHLFTPSSEAWKLQREELYEFDTHINKNYLPLELGDIFEKVGSASPKQYILLAQPCDLMVRNDGKRHPELERVPVAEVVYADSAPEYSEEMPCFDESPLRKWYIRFTRIHFVRMCVLDLCVFNQDGLAKLHIAGDAPPAIRPVWKKRYKFLSRLWMQWIRKAEQFAPIAADPPQVRQTKQQLSESFKSLFFVDDLFKGSLVEADGNRSLTFDCKRVRRLSPARALGLLMSYTSTVGRPAYDRVFGVEKGSAD